MVDSEDRYSTEKASFVQSTILYDFDAKALSNSIRPSQSYSLQVPIILKDSFSAGGWTIWCFLGLVPSGFKETPYSLDWEDSDERGHVLWLSITRRCKFLTLSPNSGSGTGLGLVCISLV
ncbi:hypothetical protein Bca4012_087263 [Brassica carinata]